jgi:hypothetical protein
MEKILLTIQKYKRYVSQKKYKRCLCFFSTVKYKGQLITWIVQGQLFQLE